MRPTDAFTASVDAIDAAIAADRADPAIDPRCTPILMRHGYPTERVVVLLHGFTNCPRQFASLAQALFALGSNVYVPRLPRHGWRDKLTDALDGLTVDELQTCATRAVDLAGALGRGTCVLGLSVGATMTAWLAQTRRLERVLAVAPFFSIAHVPSLLEPVVARALGLAPNLHLWWDPRAKERLGPAHGYPRFPTHALARCLELGSGVRDLARESAPRTSHTTLVLNAKDPAIDNAAARDILKLWRSRGAHADEYTFENLDVRHDIIEPTTYAAAPTLVYPVLTALLRR